MSDKRLLGAAVATARKPRVILVGTVGCDSVQEQLRILDWDVLSIPGGDDLACGIMARKPSVAVLPAGLDRESGYLVAAKLRAAKRKIRVVLMAATRTPEAERFARFVGATLVATTDGMSKLVEAITLPAEVRGKDCA